MDLMERATGTIKQLTAKMDAEIMQCLTDRLGKDFAVMQIDRSRLMARMEQDGITTFILDGEPFLQAWPVKIETDTEGGNHIIRASQQFKRLQTEQPE
jgi:hypothetical protein